MFRIRHSITMSNEDSNKMSTDNGSRYDSGAQAVKASLSLGGQYVGKTCECSDALGIVKRLIESIGPDNGDGVRELIKSSKLSMAGAAAGLFDELECAAVREYQCRSRSRTIDALRSLAQSFREIGITGIVIKGLSFEKMIYGDVALRDIGDIDILIRPQDAAPVHNALCSLGYRQQLGLSSGSMAQMGRARFAARVARQKYVVAGEPLRRFPYKDAFCPYVKTGFPTVELHYGFRGLPSWYTEEIVDRASEGELSLVENELDVLVLLLINTYENAESFYSNCFDDKIVLRDFIDLACCLNATRDVIDWSAARRLIGDLGITEKVGRVLRDLDDLLPGKANDILPEVPRPESLWHVGIRERAVYPNMRKRNVFRVIRGELIALARKASVGLSAASHSAGHASFCASGTPAYSLADSGDGIVLRVGGVAAKHDGSCLVEISFFPVVGDEPPLCRRVSILFTEGSPAVFCRSLDRHPDGLSMWSQAGIGLPARYDAGGCVAVVVPKEIADALLSEGEVALAAGIYDKKYGNVFWARCRGKHVLVGDVPIGHLSLYAGGGIGSAFVEFSFGRCAVASNDVPLLTSLLAVFENAEVGVPLDCDDLPVRSYVVTHGASGTYAVEAAGLSLGRGLTRGEASSRLVQDMTDWLVASLVEVHPAAHAASNIAGNGAVLCMGPSGSGKTSLGLALAKYWPLRGDECAFVNFEDGTTWAEPVPVNIKAGNAFALGLAGSHPKLACMSPLHKETFCCSRQMVESDPRPLLPVKIKAVVFPRYDVEAREVEIGRPAHDALVSLILGSLVGARAPAVHLGEFLRMISRFDIKLLTVRFSDAGLAAKSIVEHIDGWREGA